MKIFSFILLILFLAPLSGFANSPIDSIRRGVQKDVQLVKKLALLIKLSNEQIESGDKKAIFTTESAVKLAASLNREAEEAKALNLEGVAWKIWGDNQKSMFYLFKSLAIYEKIKMSADRAEVVMNIGETLRASSNFIKSIEFLNSALSIYAEIKDSAGLAKTYNRIAATYYEMYFTDRLEHNNLFNPLEDNNIVFESVYSSNKEFRLKYDQIIKFARLSDNYAVNPALTRVRISTQIIVAALYTVTYQFDRALSTYDQVLENIRNSNAETELPLALYNIALLNYKKKDLEMALSNAKACYHLANEMGIKVYILLSAGFIGNIYELQGKYREAMDYMRISYLGRMDYYQKDMDAKIKLMQYGYDIEQKNEQIRDRNILLWFLFILLFIILVLTSIIIVILLRKNKNTKILNQELINLNETLEQRVTKRTIELETTNKKLAFQINEIEQFNYIATHDLSEPLNTLTNFTNLIHENYAGKLDADGNKSIDFIFHAATRMRLLLKGLLDYSLLGKDSVRSEFDCNKVVAEILSDLSDVVKSSNAKIRLKHLPEINGYPKEFKLLFQNLIGNAIKFHKPEIQPEIEISAESHINEWVFTVKDNGMGIKKRDIESIFIIFKRMVKLSEFEGTGIGLAHCKKIVELHGGRIWVEANQNGGSTFRFTIPIIV